MSQRQVPAAEVVALLATNAERIAELARAASTTELNTAPEPGEWSATDVLAHLRSCADMWGRAIEQILAADHPTIRATNPRTWIHETDYLELEFAKSFGAFVKQRKELIASLEALSPEDWNRAATVTGAGRPLERTVHFYAQWLAKHEGPHVKQIAKAISAARTTGG